MKLREVNLQSLLHKLKSFSYVDRVNDTDVTVNVELWDDADDDGKTILSSAVGLASLVMIMKYEEEDVITTKAFSMVTRMLGK